MPVQTIPPADVHGLQQSGQTLDILDVRTPAEYAVAHIPGAQLMPLDTLDAASIAAQRNGKTLYVICEKGGRAAKACQKLTDAGAAQVLSIEGGTSAWISAGLPVVRSGGKVISIERQVRIVAGSLVLLFSLLALFVHVAFIGIPIFVGAGLTFAGITDFCGMAIILGKMPWNRGATPGSCATK